MTQYKEKSQKFIMANGTNTIPTGIFLYPTLMSSDILLYNANFVPCGYDQVQHVELARDIAEKFNKKYGQTFILPKAIIEEKESKKIYSLNKPFEKKMSKSEPEGCL
jgi:tryptophanyl-tRNA synthetase